MAINKITGVVDVTDTFNEIIDVLNGVVKQFEATASGNTASITLTGDYIAGFVVGAYVNAPNGNWVSTGAVTSIYTNGAGTVLTVVVDGYYASRKVKVLVAKHSI